MATAFDLNLSRENGKTTSFPPSLLLPSRTGDSVLTFISILKSEPSEIRIRVLKGGKFDLDFRHVFWF